jgi:hypothetical protein
MKWPCLATILIGLLLLPQNVFALDRWECRGNTADKIVLTPYQDQSVNLSFNDGGVEATTQFSYHGDVLTAMFQDLNGPTLYIVIIDTIARNGYEVVQIPGQEAVATKITCSGSQK